jgi:hypothetical protein
MTNVHHPPIFHAYHTPLQMFRAHHNLTVSSHGKRSSCLHIGFQGHPGHGIITLQGWTEVCSLRPVAVRDGKRPRTQQLAQKPVDMNFWRNHLLLVLLHEDSYA